MAAVERNLFSRQDDFAITYSLLSNEINFESRHSDSFDFRTSFLYKYMSRVFQYVDEDLNSYQNPNRYYWCKILRVLSMIVMWLCVVFRFVQFFYSEISFLKTASLFQLLVFLVNYIMWMVRYLVIHHFGVLTFCRIPSLAVQLIESLKREVESEEDLKRINLKLKNKERQVNKIIASAFLCIFLLHFLNGVIPVIITEVRKPGSSNFNFWIEFFNFLVLLYTRIVSLPFLYYLIFISYLQCIELEEFCQMLPRTIKSADDIFHEYVKIHQKINNSAKKVHLYLSVSIGTVVIWGLLAVYSFVQKLSNFSRSSTDEFTVIFDVIFTFLSNTVEVVYLFLLPWLLLSNVSKKQTKVIVSVLAIPFSKMDWSSPFNNVSEILQFSSRLEDFQKHAGTGYKVFGIEMNKVKTVWLFILAPVGLLLANSAIKGDLKPNTL